MIPRTDDIMSYMNRRGRSLKLAREIIKRTAQSGVIALVYIVFLLFRVIKRQKMTTKLELLLCHVL